MNIVTKFTKGETVYIVSNNVFIMKMEIVSIYGDFYTLRSLEGAGGTRLKKHRLYATEEEAQKVIDGARKKNASDRGLNRW